MTSIISVIIVVCTGMIGQAETARAQAPYAVLHSFAEPASPWAPLVSGSDGSFYGTTLRGGISSNGTVFKLAADGTGFTTLRSFTGSDGAYPRAGLIQGSDGSLYGTTARGGSSGRGTIFKIAPDGTGFATLHIFTGLDGDSPHAELVQGPDGALYGTTNDGGTLGWGTIFKINADGTGFSTLHTFTLDDGARPEAALVQGTDGAFYGTTDGGGSWWYGTVFKLDADGTGFTSLYSFTGSEGMDVSAPLVQGSDGAFYGTTSQSDYPGYGTVYKLGADGTGFTTLRFFNGLDGAFPRRAGLIQGSDGAFYGTTMEGGALNLGTVFKLAADGTGFTTLHSFDGADGSYPAAGLVQGPDGALLGTTIGGVVFVLQPSALPTVTLNVNQPTFHAGQEITLVGTVSPSTTPMTADVYVGLQLPNGKLLFLQNGGGLTTAIQPFVTNWSLCPFSGPLFSYTFGGGEPAGNYLWLAAFTPVGSKDFSGLIASVPFIFSP